MESDEISNWEAPSLGLLSSNLYPCLKGFYCHQIKGHFLHPNVTLLDYLPSWVSHKTSQRNLFVKSSYRKNHLHQMLVLRSSRSGFLSLVPMQTSRRWYLSTPSLWLTLPWCRHCTVARPGTLVINSWPNLWDAEPVLCFQAPPGFLVWMAYMVSRVRKEPKVPQVRQIHWWWNFDPRT